ncbi:TetR family transcriptional regulator [Breoghania corrubedonensis]|uniref:TetR family transcriptional regulator n=1 Tax=Breoghania corrubedonensis TaxID=665038 RepID=A0A2T5UNW7_9HYPH|nr:TetR family transcriptional regulator [Breoghania corrubedonensis]PTW53198.1 TetR family transcriptional regulator [Breoghania corrubedonensis]
MTTEKTRKSILEAFMGLVAERPWPEVTMAAVAERAGIKPSALRKAYDGRMAILAEFYRRIDAEVLDGCDPEIADEPALDRLFDVLMRRLDALEPYKNALQAIGRSARRDPVFAAELNSLALTSQRWMLTAAGINASGVRGLALTQALVVAYLKVMRVWLKDEDPGKASTMAALDRELKRGADILGRIDRADRWFAPFRRAFAQRGKRADAGSRAARHEPGAAAEV